MNRPSQGGFRWARNKYAPNATSPPKVVLPVTTGNTAIYLGDPVKVDSNGTVVVAAAGDAIFGIMAGARQYWDGSAMRAGGSLPVVSWGTVAARQSQVEIIPVRGQLFRVTCDDAVTATTQLAYDAFVQENCEWVTGTANGDESGCLLDISLHAVTNTLSVRIEEVPDKTSTNFAGTGVELLVSFNLIQDTGSGAILGT